jgi:hypothetical protein
MTNVIERGVYQLIRYHISMKGRKIANGLAHHFDLAKYSSLSMQQTIAKVINHGTAFVAQSSYIRVKPLYQPSVKLISLDMLLVHVLDVWVEFHQ